MPHSHYVMDSYYPDSAARDGFRHEAMRLFADDDAEAMTEGQRIVGWKKPSHYSIRAIHTSSRTGDKLIFSSPRDEPPAAPDA